jgi:hypothetical protein
MFRCFDEADRIPCDLDKFADLVRNRTSVLRVSSEASKLGLAEKPRTAWFVTVT